jgi:hypothetical protein
MINVNKTALLDVSRMKDIKHPKQFFGSIPIGSKNLDDP